MLVKLSGSTILCRAEQFENAPEARSATLLGSVILVKLEQFLNA